MVFMESNSQPKPQVIITKGLRANSPFGIIMPKRKKLKARDILAIHSQLIRGFVGGHLLNQDAKDLSYLCSNYLSALQVVEFEDRISKLEKSIEPGE